jgi:hypothetical protein
MKNEMLSVTYSITIWTKNEPKGFSTPLNPLSSRIGSLQRMGIVTQNGVEAVDGNA